MIFFFGSITVRKPSLYAALIASRSIGMAGSGTSLSNGPK
jgi:hypothetical protein